MYDNNTTTCVVNVSKEYKNDLEKMKRYINTDLKQQIALGVIPSVETLKNFLTVMSAMERKIQELDKIVTVYSKTLPF